MVKESQCIDDHSGSFSQRLRTARTQPLPTNTPTQRQWIAVETLTRIQIPVLTHHLLFILSNTVHYVFYTYTCVPLPAGWRRLWWRWGGGGGGLLFSRYNVMWSRPVVKTERLFFSCLFFINVQYEARKHALVINASNVWIRLPVAQCYEAAIILSFNKSHTLSFFLWFTWSVDPPWEDILVVYSSKYWEKPNPHGCGLWLDTKMSLSDMSPDRKQNFTKI